MIECPYFCVKCFSCVIDNYETCPLFMRYSALKDDLTIVYKHNISSIEFLVLTGRKPWFEKAKEKLEKLGHKVTLEPILCY